LLGLDRLAAVANDGLEAGTRIGVATKSNPYFSGAMQLIVNPRETGYHATLLDLSKPGVRPIKLVLNKSPEAVSMDQMDSFARWTRDKLQYAVEADLGIGPGEWQAAYKMTGTA